MRKGELDVLFSLICSFAFTRRVPEFVPAQFRYANRRPISPASVITVLSSSNLIFVCLSDTLLGKHQAETAAPSKALFRSTSSLLTHFPHFAHLLTAERDQDSLVSLFASPLHTCAVTMTISVYLSIYFVSFYFIFYYLCYFASYSALHLASLCSFCCR